MTFNAAFDTPHEPHNDVRTITVDDVAALVDELMDPNRTYPVVAVTTTWSGDFNIDPHEVKAVVGDAAEVVVLETGPVTFALAEMIEPEFEIYGGHLRVWFPGLTENSDRDDHPILWMSAPEHERRTRIRLAEELGIDRQVPSQRLRAVPDPAAERALAFDRHFAVGERVQARVVEVADWGALFDVDGVEASATFGFMAAEAPRKPSDVVVVGMTVPATIGAITDDGGIRLELTSMQGDPWTVAGEQVSVGDLIRVRVKRTGTRGSTVEMLPGVQGYVTPARGGSQCPWGEVRLARLVSINVTLKEAQLSFADVPTSAVGAKGLRIYPDGPCYLSDGDDDAAARTEVESLQLRVEELQGMLTEAEAERDTLRAELAKLRKRLTDQRRTPQNDTTKGPDPFASEVSLKAAIEAEHAQRTRLPADAEQYPLRRWELGREFLQSARTLQGIPAPNIVTACAHVASDRAHKINAYNVHAITLAKNVVPHVVPAKGARAWRLSLQESTSSARRMHYWVSSTTDGERVVEFIDVDTHDAYLD